MGDTGPEVTFTDTLEHWLNDDSPKSLGDLGNVFAEKSFAAATVLLMIVGGLPIPTGGVALLFEVMAAIVAAQMVLGRRTIWLPARLRQRQLGQLATGRTLPFMLRRLRWLERHSRPRWVPLFHRQLFMRLVGLVLTVFALVACLAPPLSGLETLPALGSILIALALILEDMVILGIGLVVGIGGILLFVRVGIEVVDLVSRFL
jgi:hypothetical protein